MAKIKAGFRAGDMVTITAEAEESEWTPAGRIGSGYAVADYHYTAADTAAWRANQIKAIAEAREAGEDTFSIAMDSAGESRLPPQGGCTKLFAGTALSSPEGSVPGKLQLLQRNWRLDEAARPQYWPRSLHRYDESFRRWRRNSSLSRVIIIFC